MIEFAGTLYYIDLDAFNNLILLETKENFVTTEKREQIKEGYLEKTTDITYTSDKDREINIPKYDVLRLMLEKIIDNEDEMEESLGSDRALSKTSFSFKIAFNTLIECGVLKEKE